MLQHLRSTCGVLGWNLVSRNAACAYSPERQALTTVWCPPLRPRSPWRLPVPISQGFSPSSASLYILWKSFEAWGAAARPPPKCMWPVKRNSPCPGRTHSSSVETRLLRQPPPSPSGPAGTPALLPVEPLTFRWMATLPLRLGG